MKISTILVAGAQAWTCGNPDPQPCDFRRWWKENWWSSASETFNFASNNWEKFADSIESVNQAKLVCKEISKMF